MSDEHKSDDKRGAPDDAPIEAPKDASKDASVRATVELPRVVLGSDEGAHRAPRERVLPGRIDIRWLSYSAYIACILGAGLSVNFALDSREWAIVPISIGWAMLYVWEWIYGVAYQYRRPILKYSALFMVLALAAVLASVCLDRAPAQDVIAGGELIARARVVGLEGAAALTILSALLILAHGAVLGRGYRRIKQRDTTASESG